jgi:predicted Zn-dependent protease
MSNTPSRKKDSVASKTNTPCFDVVAASCRSSYTARMKPLLAPDAHHFNAAVGWLELGNRAEARAELALVSAENLHHPLVLDLRWSLDAEEKKWDAALVTAQAIIATLPNEAAGWLHCAYALRRAKSGGLEKALAFLEPAANTFPDEPVIAFNLACYACQLNQLDEARRWLKRASDIGGAKEMRAMALADEDLKPLWPELKNQ